MAEYPIERKPYRRAKNNAHISARKATGRCGNLRLRKHPDAPMVSAFYRPRQIHLAHRFPKPPPKLPENNPINRARNRGADKAAGAN